MPLTQEAIDELKQIHKEECDEELSNQEAWDMDIRLLNLAKTLCTAKQQKSDDKK